ncbi:MAG TPA: metallophosphoesterase family protein [Thermoanaerobaculia bacterium]|nr:metallophosphoesterase family protein [Thermoanaerobaculia bacterium]
MRLGFIGGIYSNYHALVATLDELSRRSVDATYFLGDLGAFGPHPDRVPELLIARGIAGIQGNYEESLSTRADDCHCGYTDPRDNHYAQISYDYTFAHTSDAHKDWMGSLPREIRFTAGGLRFLLVHGSPRKINEFLWRSTSPEPFLEKLCRDHDADVIVCTHTGLHWHKALREQRHVINAGVIGRPANDGRTNVWTTIVDVNDRDVQVEFVPIAYDHERLAREMREERLPEEFVETVLSGWWTTCLEILPPKERALGKY